MPMYGPFWDMITNITKTLKWYSKLVPHLRKVVHNTCRGLQLILINVKHYHSEYLSYNHSCRKVNDKLVVRSFAWNHAK